MANPSLQIGNNKWAIKKDNLLGYRELGNNIAPVEITMTRASAGTRINPQGLVETVELLGSELVTNGDFATDSDWTKGAGWTISGGTASHTGGASYLSQDVLQVDTLYKVNISVTAVSGGGFVQIYMGNSPASVLISTIGDFTYYFTSQSSVILGFALRSLGDVTIDNVSVKESTKNDLARVDYTDGTSSLLVEPQRTNNLTASQDLTDSFWNSINTETIVASTVLSPDGTTFGFKAIPSTSTSTHYVDYDYGFLSMPSGVEVTYSVFAKPFGYTNFQLATSSGMNSRYQNFELTGDGVLGSGNVNGATIKKIGDWYRCTITEGTTSTTPRVLNIATPSSGLGRNPSFTGNGTDGVLLWGAQMEEGTYPTSYIPNLSTTSGSTVTRNQETYEKTGISDKINSEEGVLFVEFKTLSETGTFRQFNLSKDNSNRIYITKRGDNGNLECRMENPSGSLNFSFAENTTNDFVKVAFRYGLNNFAVFIDGVNKNVTATGNVFASGTLNTLEFDSPISQPFFGKVKQIQVYKTALSDSELATLTT